MGHERGAVDRAIRVHGWLAAHGGFTLDPRTEQLGGSGFAVCADPQASLRFGWLDWVDEHVERWWQQASALVHADGALHLGGWLDERSGHVWLDLVWIFGDHERSAAEALARSHDQHAIFDLTRGELVMVQVGQLEVPA